VRLAPAVAAIPTTACGGGGPAPAGPASGARRDREVPVGTAPWALPGTLSMPAGPGPFPAVVLVQGSGPADRDETIGQVKPFRDIARYLAARGIAVLRYDKRTLVYAKASAADPSLVAGLTTRGATTDDAEAGVDLLPRTPQVDPRRLFVAGHSLGGGLAPRIVADRPVVRGYASLEGFARQLQDILVDQIEHLAGPSPSPAQAAAIAQATAWAAEVSAGDLPLDMPRTQWPFGIEPAYWNDLRGYHPAPAGAALAQPVLVMQGDNAYPVAMAEFRPWQAAPASRSPSLIHH